MKQYLFLLILVVGLVSVAAATDCAPPTVQCDQDGNCHNHISIDVTGGPPGCDPWHELDIKPGFSKCSSVDITNDGNMEGTLYIVIRDITGDYDLGKYMFFTVENARIVTNVQFPATVYDFPSEPEAEKFVAISNFKSGQTVTLNWCWNFLETGTPQNEAQGKSLGFTLYYILRSPDISTCIEDDDRDGVCNDRDYCPGTTDWRANILLLPNHYDSSNMDMLLSHGCSCYQILSCKPGETEGEYKYGCTEGTLDVWYDQEADWTKNCEPAEGEPAGMFAPDGPFGSIIKWFWLHFNL